MTIETQGEAWSRVARRRKEIMIGYLQPMWNAVLEATGAGRGVRLLDTGCGSGEMVGLALERGCDVVGLDVAPTMIELCRGNPALAKATFLEGSTEQLPFEPGSFDVATAVMSVHFCDDVPRALRELHRVLRPGGRVGVVAPASMSLDVLIVFELAKEMVSHMADDIMRPAMFAPDHVLASALGAAGFSGVGERVVDTPLAGKSFEDVWEAQKVWAPVKTAVDTVGEAAFLAAYRARLRERVGEESPSCLGMAFRVVTGVKPSAA